MSHAEKEGRLDLKGSTGRPKKVTRRVDRKISKTLYESRQSNKRGLALQAEKDLGLRVSHENTNIFQEWLGKNPCCPHKMYVRDYDLLPNTFHFLRSTGMVLFSQIRRK